MLMVFGGFMILVGFLSLIRYRFVSVRRRLTPAASIRGRGPSGNAVVYPTGSGSSMGRSVSMLLMATGGIVALAGILAV
jgi:hypothetical protein